MLAVGCSKLLPPLLSKFLLFGTFHFLSEIFMRTPFNALMYEKAANYGSYVDEYTVLREISLNLGRVLMGLFLIALIYLVGLKIAFPLAAVFSLLVNLL